MSDRENTTEELHRQKKRGRWRKRETDSTSSMSVITVLVGVAGFTVHDEDRARCEKPYV